MTAPWFDIPTDPSVRDAITQFVLQRLGLDDQPRLSVQQAEELVKRLPRLTERDVISRGQEDSVCPICFTPLMAIIAEEELALAMDSPGQPVEDLGVTCLDETWQCGHFFCRKDISKWIGDYRDTCPTCRRPFLQQPPNQPQHTTNLDESELLRQIQALVGDMQENNLRFTGLSPFVSETQTDTQRDDDRSDYSAMYS